MAGCHSLPLSYWFASSAMAPASAQACASIPLRLESWLQLKVLRLLAMVNVGSAPEDVVVAVAYISSWVGIGLAFTRTSHEASSVIRPIICMGGNWVALYNMGWRR